MFQSNGLSRKSHNSERRVQFAHNICERFRKLKLQKVGSSSAKERRDIFLNKLIQHFCICWLLSWSWRDLLQLCCSTPWQGFWHTTSLRFGTWKHASFYVPTGGSTTKLRLLILLLLPWIPRKHVKLRCIHRILHDLRRFIHCQCQHSQIGFSNPSNANLIFCSCIIYCFFWGVGCLDQNDAFWYCPYNNSSDFLNFTSMDQILGYASHLLGGCVESGSQFSHFCLVWMVKTMLKHWGTSTG